MTLAATEIGDPLFLSLQVGLAATFVGLVPGMALAYWLARTRSFLRPWVEAVVLLPMVLPPVVVGLFLLDWFGTQGFIGGWLFRQFGIRWTFTWAGAALAALVMGFPLMVRTMRQAFEAVDPELEEASAVLGAGRWETLTRVTVPLAARGLIAGATLCFARSLGEFGATMMFAGNVPGQTSTLSLSIWTAFQAGEDELVWRLAWVCAGVSVVATVFCELLVRRRSAGVRP